MHKFTKYLEACLEAGCESGALAFGKLIQKTPLTDDEWWQLVFYACQAIEDRAERADAQESQASPEPSCAENPEPAHIHLMKTGKTQSPPSETV